jgi:hypothetical protein
MADQTDIFGDDPNDELDVDPSELIIGTDPEEDFGDVDEEPKAAAEPEPETATAEPEPGAADHLARASQAQQNAEAWAQEVERRAAAYAEAKAAVAAAEKAYDAGEGSVDAKLEAIEKLTNANYDVRRAQETQQQAKQYAEHQATANPVKDAWAAANPRLATDPKFLADANAAFEAIKADGMDSHHPRFYAELDKRLKRTPPMNRTGRTSGAPVTAGAQTRGTEALRLTEGDKEQLRAWGLVKPGMTKEKRIAVAKEYLRQKTIAAGERRAG